MEREETGGFFRRPGGRLRLGWRLLLFVAAFVFLAGGLAVVVPAEGLALQTLPLLAAAVVAGWGMLALDGRRPGALGFPLSLDLARGSLGGLALGVTTALLVVALIAVGGGLRWTSEPGSLGAWIGTGAWALVLLALPAAAEEALFRGYPLQALAEAWGNGVALGVTSVTFALLHLGNPEVGAISLLNIAAAGLFLGTIYLRTGSLWWATGAHLGWNWTHAFAVDVPVSGLELVDAPGLEAVVGDPWWWSGGRFGPEGSLASTVVLLAGTLVLPRLGWLRPDPELRRADPLVRLPPEPGAAPPPGK